jgi:diaminohydroxyphosphoribosylaminopyrimidine deaminase/5-amino-6-(5-phosphoribosylamino)uracil reductase
LVTEAGIAEVVIGIGDPDPRTAGAGIARLQAAGIEVRLSDDPACRESLTGYLVRTALGRPHITLKLATSLDGRIALADGTSRWITGERARAHAHVERARSDAILVGAGTLRADAPKLDVRLPGLEGRSPRRCVLTRGEAPQGWTAIASPQAVRDLPEAQYLLVEGGAETAAAFIAADLVDRLLLYRAPILIGSGRPCLGDVGVGSLDEAHNRWRREATRALGTDTLEILTRIR